MAYWDNARKVDTVPPMKEPLHLWKVEMQTTGQELKLTVKNAHGPYKQGKVIHLRCTSAGRDDVVKTIQNFQRYSAWLDEQWHSPQNMAKIAQAESTGGTSWFTAAKYESVAKVTLEKTVIPRGCKYEDATKVYAAIHDNKDKGKTDCALQDVEQTCAAFRDHFDRKANRAECIQRFAFCLYFYTAMRETLQAIDGRLHRQLEVAAQERVEDVLKSLKRILLESADQRKALQAAIMECDLEYCSQMLVSPLQNARREVLLPLSNLQASNKAVKLSVDKDWEMFFTMILLESAVFVRLQEHVLLQSTDSSRSVEF